MISSALKYNKEGCARMKLPMMKLSIISIVVLYVLAFAYYPNCTTNEYCFKREASFGDSIVILKMVEREGECYRKEEVGDRTIKYYYGKEEVIFLSEEYKFCQWSSGFINTEVSLDENLTLETEYIFQKTSTGHQIKRKEYDSVVISGVSKFYCYECGEEPSVKNGKYNELILPILKNSIGKTFMADMAIKVNCPRDANDTNYSERKILKINRPIVVTGKCPE